MHTLRLTIMNRHPPGLLYSPLKCAGGDITVALSSNLLPNRVPGIHRRAGSGMTGLKGSRLSIRRSIGGGVPFFVHAG